MHSEVTLPNTLTSSLITFAMAESKSRFATLSEEDSNLLLDDKDEQIEFFSDNYLNAKQKFNSIRFCLKPCLFILE